MIDLCWLINRESIHYCTAHASYNDGKTRGFIVSSSYEALMCAIAYEVGHEDDPAMFTEKYLDIAYTELARRSDIAP